MRSMAPCPFFLGIEELEETSHIFLGKGSRRQEQEMWRGKRKEAEESIYERLELAGMRIHRGWGFFVFRNGWFRPIGVPGYTPNRAA